MLPVPVPGFKDYSSLLGGMLTASPAQGATSGAQNTGLPGVTQPSGQIPGLPGAPQSQSQVPQILAALRSAGGALGAGGKLAGALGYDGSTLGQVGGALGGAAGLGTGVYNLTQGHYGPGAIQTAQGAYNLGTAATGTSPVSNLLSSLIGAGGSEILGAYGGFGAGYDLTKLAFNLAGMKGGATTGNPYGDIGFSLLGPFGDAGKALVGELLGPSSAWTNFPYSLQETLQGSQQNLQHLAQGLQYVQNRGDLDQLVSLYNQQMRGVHHLQGYQDAPRVNGAPQIMTPPGATGTQHEGGIQGSFNPQVQQINTVLQQAYAQLPEGLASSPLSAGAFGMGYSEPMFNQYQGLLGALQSQLGGSTLAYNAFNNPAPSGANLSPELTQAISQAPSWAQTPLTQNLQAQAFQALAPNEGINYTPSD